MRKWAAPDTRRGLAYFFALLGNFFLKQYRGILKTCLLYTSDAADEL